MNRTKKFLLATLSALALTAGAIGMTSCDTNSGTQTPNNSSTQQTETNDFRLVYAMYVEYATAQGKTPDSYETWLMSIRGQDGKDGQDGADGKDGQDGADGQDGLTPYIGENGNWWIGDMDTEISASGLKGDKGDKGDQGEQGIQGDKGDKGDQGEQGKIGRAHV